jgi:hypothetical protein
MRPLTIAHGATTAQLMAITEIIHANNEGVDKI